MKRTPTAEEIRTDGVFMALLDDPDQTSSLEVSVWSYEGEVFLIYAVGTDEWVFLRAKRPPDSDRSHPRAVLSYAQEREVRAALTANESQREVAERMGVSRGAILRIWRRMKEGLVEENVPSLA